MEIRELYLSLIEALKNLKDKPNSLFYRGQVTNLKNMISEKIASEDQENFVSALIAVGFGAIGFKEAFLNMEGKEFNDIREEYFNIIKTLEETYPNRLAKMTMDAIGFKID